MKRINKILWHGNEIPLPSAYEGSLDGLNRGELFIYEDDEDPAIFIKTNKNKVKRIGGSGGGGGTTDINEILDLIDQKLNGYATEEWVSSTYATKTALSTLSSSVNSLRTDFNNLNALLNDDVTGKINTWHEVVDFLDEYSGSQDLAAILSGMNTDIASRVEKSKFAEYFNSEMAKWFVKDDNNKGIKPVNSYGLYSDTYVSAKGVSTGTSGGGGGTSYDRLDSWAEYTSAKAGYVLSALLGYDLHTRVNNLTNSLGGYLPLSGGTIDSGSNRNALTINSSDGSGPLFGLNVYDVNRVMFGVAPTASYGAFWSYIDGNVAILLGTNGKAYIANEVNAFSDRKEIIHGGNIGSYKAGDSDKLAGYGLTRFLLMTGRDYTAMDLNTIGDSQSIFTEIRTSEITTTNSPFSGYGALLSLKDRGGVAKMQFAGTWDSSALYFRSQQKSGESITSDWKTIAFTDSNVASATKLQTARTIWGQSFDGSGDVSGNIHLGNGTTFEIGTGYSTGDPTRYNKIVFGAASSGLQYISGGWTSGNVVAHHFKVGIGNTTALAITDKGNVLIGTTTDNGAKLQVNGDISVDTIKLRRGAGAETKYALEVETAYGKSWFGMMNTYACHIYTDAPMFYTNKYLSVPKLESRGDIIASGGVTAKSSSDYRLKCEFDYGVDYQERLLSLGKVCDFNYTPHAQEREFAFADDKRHTSVIWQDARKANITGFCSVEEDGYGTINPLSSDLIFTMVGAIQQGITKTERIEDRVVRLEKENEALRKEINDMKGGRYGC